MLSKMNLISDEINFDKFSENIYYMVEKDGINCLYSYNLSTKEIKSEYVPSSPWKLINYYKRTGEDTLLLLMRQKKTTHSELWMQNCEGELKFLGPEESEICNQGIYLEKVAGVISNIVNKISGESYLRYIDLSSGMEEDLIKHDGLISIQTISPCGNYVVIIFSEKGFKVKIGVLDLRNRKLIFNSSFSLRVESVVWHFNNEGFYILTNELTEYISIYYVSLDNFLKGNFLNSMEEVYVGKNDIEQLVSLKDGVIFTSNTNGYSTISHLNSSSKIEEIYTNIKGVITGFSLSNDNRKLAFKISTINSPGDICIYNLNSKCIDRLGLNKSKTFYEISLLQKSLTSTGPYLNNYSSNIIAKKKYPAIILLHGGPHKQDRPSFNPLKKLLVKQGFVVICPNISGSTGYGKTYEESILGGWGGQDLDEIKQIYNWLQKQEWVIKDRIFLCGFSYGAYLTLLAVSKLECKFYKAIAISGPVNLLDFINNMPLETQNILQKNVGDSSSEDKRKYLLSNSPSTYITSISCPILIAHGSQDDKINRDSIFKYVKKAISFGKDMTYYEVEGEGHSLSYSNTDINSLLTDCLKFMDSNKYSNT
ncbi:MULTISPECIES: alpha/beta hydrolase family protein [Bacillaceae]|uniref:Prolyl oligopeptidase family serine peptidase n=1 Tax=Evansella alkalicola TaxID=745819 RepID=A0ABS6JXB8_9BACI|nr:MULTISPECIES: prolyl oligopeptidase family serine peptidase [Bacillaceae]MBU9723233.1 prolyl oligopeptidase family serine peptidase [Bacillus alkalicola]